MSEENTGIWIHPDDPALAFLGRSKPQREVGEQNGEREQKNRQKAGGSKKASSRRPGPPAQKQKTEKTALVRRHRKPAVVMPIVKAPDLAPMPEPSTADLSRVEGVLARTFETFDLSQPEGFLDRWIGRPNHRIRKKIQKSEDLGRYTDALVAQLRRLNAAREEVRRMHEIQRKDYLDAVRTAREVTEEKMRLALLARQAERQEAMDDARARAVIANYDRDARNAERDLLPPPPQPDPLEKAWADRMTNTRLKLQELDARAEFEVERVALARSRVRHIIDFGGMSRDEMREQIRQILDAYEVSDAFLPPDARKILDEAPSWD